MANKTPFSPAKIKICPKGLHSFAFYILIFDFLSPFSLIPCPFSLAPNVIVRKYLRVDKALYICREPSTTIESSLQISPFLTNKANFRKSQMNVSTVITMNYEQRTMNDEIKNKPNTNPIQSQYKPNSNPIQSQFKPKQTKFQRRESAAVFDDKAPACPMFLGWLFDSCQPACDKLA
jgi:hypothetical protein